MPPKSNSKMAAAFIVVGVGAAIAAQYGSRNAQGVTIPATTDVRYSAVGSPATQQSADSFPDEAHASATEVRSATVNADTLRVGSSVAPAVPENGATIEDQCPQCARCLRPCTDTPHTRLQCTDPMVEELKATPNVWEVWCMNGKTEIRQPGKWPPPASTASKTGVFTMKTVAAVAAKAAPSLCSPYPLETPAHEVCGWYRAKDGDRYHARTGYANWGEAAAWKPATVGSWYFVYGGLITHVTALPCGDERVRRAVAGGVANVYCEYGGASAPGATGGVLRVYNDNDAALEPLRVFSDHDRLMRGIVVVTTEGR